MFKTNVNSSVTEYVINKIKNNYFKGGNEAQKFMSRELDVIQSAVCLDALGAIGIARTFNYGGFKNRMLVDPDIEQNLNMTKEDYKSSTSPTINPFYEKLLLLKDKMNTKTGRRILSDMHNFMKQILQYFSLEWEGI